MRTIIVTGLSGAGKSQAIQILEDAEFFCVDNVPPKLVRTFVDLCQSGDSAQNFFDRVEGLMESVIPQYRNVGKEHLEVAFGCTGGQHRSVTYAYLMEEAFRKKGYLTNINHRDMEMNREQIGR